MSDSHSPLSSEQIRSYLLVLSKTLIPVRFQSKIDAEGLVQQTLLEAWQTPFSGAQIPRLRRILICNLRDQLRHLTTQKRGRGLEISLDQSLQDSSAKLQAFLADDESRPSQKIRRKETEVTVALALDALPPRQQEAVLLYYWHGQNTTEIGQLLGISPAAAARLIHRGLAALKQKLRRENLE